jgi:hypothetical protein
VPRGGTLGSLPNKPNYLIPKIFRRNPRNIPPSSNKQLIELLPRGGTLGSLPNKSKIYNLTKLNGGGILRIFLLIVNKKFNLLRALGRDPRFIF